MAVAPGPQQGTEEVCVLSPVSVYNVVCIPYQGPLLFQTL